MEDSKEVLLQRIKLVLALKHSNDDKLPSELFEYLYLGSIGAALNKDILKDIGITHILTIADNLSPPFPADFTYKTISFTDNSQSDLRAILSEALGYIEHTRQSGGKVLVHW